jgi:hypothetical protein
MSRVARFALLVSGLAATVGIGAFIWAAGAAGPDRVKPVPAARAAADAATAARPTSVAPAADPVLVKIQGYISCLNDFSPSTEYWFNWYFAWADRKTGPTGHERNVYAPGTLDDPSACEAKVAESNALPPALPALQTAAADYARALRTLHPLLNDANGYYKEELYKDDAMAKGRSLHPRIMTALAALTRAEAELRGELKRVGHEARVRALAELEAREGRTLRFLGDDTMLLARELVDVVQDKPLAAIDSAALTRAIDAFQPIVAELEPAAARHFAEPRSAGFDGVEEKMVIDEMIGDAKDLVRRAKELARHTSGKLHYSDFERQHMRDTTLVEGSPAGVIAAYNRLVQAGNRRR